MTILRLLSLFCPREGWKKLDCKEHTLIILFPGTARALKSWWNLFKVKQLRFGPSCCVLSLTAATYAGYIQQSLNSQLNFSSATWLPIQTIETRHAQTVLFTNSFIKISNASLLTAHLQLPIPFLPHTLFNVSQASQTCSPWKLPETFFLINSVCFQFTLV